jgi:sulfate/thiosulfate-binding protein
LSTFRRFALPVALTALLALTVACGGGSATSGSDDTGGVRLALVAYSTPQEAYEKIIAAFQKTDAGNGVTFSQSYGGSGDQSRAVESGLEADLVAFALEPDMTRLVKAGLVDAGWNTDEHKGNPKSIKTWADLTKEGVQVLNPNPFTSGGARWNVMAAWGQITKNGGSEDDAIVYLNALFKNIPVQDDSARKALQTFTSGKGDVMLGYENEAIFAQQKGQAIDYVVPDSTILIENPVAVTKESKHPAEAKAFLDFLRTEEAQKIYADSGYRPIVDGVEGPHDFPTPARLFTIADFGGWDAVSKKFFDPEGSIVAAVEQNIGVSVVT